MRFEPQDKRLHLSQVFGVTPNPVSALRYREVCVALLSAGDLSAAKMFGAPGLRVSGKFFCCLHRDKLLVKLPLERAGALVASGAGRQAEHFFADRPLTGWIEVAPDGGADWIKLTEESRDFVRRENPIEPLTPFAERRVSASS